MVIDCHCHLWSSDVPSPLWKDSLVDIGVRRSGTERSTVEEYIEDGYFDLTGDMLVEDMDRAGIDKAILNILDFGLRNDERGGTSLNEQHQIYADAVANHPDRLSFLGGIDPQRPHPGKFVDKAVDKWSIKGVKLHPTTGFYPDDSSAYLVYQKCVEHDIPVMIHTGPEIAPFSAKYARPVYVDDVANDFPELDIVMAHAGGVWWEEAAKIGSTQDNIYVDLAYWQGKYLNEPQDRVFRQLRWMIDNVGKSKVLFGSDWPALRLVDEVNNEHWVDILQELPERGSEYGVEFTEEEIDLILGKNAQRLFFKS